MQSKVAPFAGAWIEIEQHKIFSRKTCVAPFAGAWIEIRLSKSVKLISLSLPLRERGLKFGHRMYGYSNNQSLPLRERGLKLRWCVRDTSILRRSLCGSVD